MKSIRSIVTVLFVLIAAGLTTGTDLEQHRSCSQCGMDRKAYGYSRMVIEHNDGTTSGVCSLHCAVRHISSTGGTIKAILVADRDGQDLLNAADAVWVMGGNKRGVMTREPKWAFRTETAALSFIKAHGGKRVSWEEARAAANDELLGGGK